MHPSGQVRVLGVGGRGGCGSKTSIAEDGCRERVVCESQQHRVVLILWNARKM